MEIDQGTRESKQLFYSTFSQAVWENDFRELHNHTHHSFLSKTFLNTHDKKLYTPLHYVSSVGDVKMSEFLLDQGSHINMPDKDGNTALLWAAKKGHITVIISLIEKYLANVNIQNYAGESALLLASCNNDEKMVSFLLDNRASPNLSNLRGEYPLHIAAAFGYVNIMELLVKNGGAWLECEDEVGDSPLHFAVREGQIEAIEWLLRQGADPGHPNEDDETPFHLAQDLGDKRVVRIFKSLAGVSSDVSSMDANDVSQFDSYVKFLHMEVAGKLSLAN